MDFPTTRMRRYRKNAKIREVMRETKLNIEDLIYPLYAAEDIKDNAWTVQIFHKRLCRICKRA